MEYLGNYFCGAVAGTVSAVISHPLFVLKTDLQNGKKLSELTGNMNRKYLYSGLTRMCIGLGFEKMLVFGTYNSIFHHFDLDRDNFYHSLGSGFLAGIVGSFASTPAEQLVINKMGNIKKYGLGHLYKGLLPTMGRESVGFSVYFCVFDQLSKKYNPEKSISKTMMIGTCSITSALLFFYPLDKIKTNIQSGVPFNIRENPYKGIHLGLPRSIVFHVSCFVIFQCMSDFL